MSFQAEEEITAQVKTTQVGNSSFEVFEGIVDDEYHIPVAETGHAFKPVIVITHGGATETAKRYQHLCGASRDSEIKIFTVTVIGSEDSSVRRVMDRIKRKLIGFEPYNSGEIRLALYATTNGRDTKGSPTRYTAVQTFTYMSNAEIA